MCSGHICCTGSRDGVDRSPAGFSYWGFYCNCSWCSKRAYGRVVVLAILLNAMGFPTDYIGMFMAIDILCDMPKTLLNAYSVSCSAIIVAHSEGEALHV